MKRRRERYKGKLLQFWRLFSVLGLLPLFNHLQAIYQRTISGAISCTLKCHKKLNVIKILTSLHHIVDDFLFRCVFRLFLQSSQVWSRGETPVYCFSPSFQPCFKAQTEWYLQQEVLLVSLTPSHPFNQTCCSSVCGNFNRKPWERESGNCCYCYCLVACWPFAD